MALGCNLWAILAQKRPAVKAQRFLAIEEAPLAIAPPGPSKPPPRVDEAASDPSSSSRSLKRSSSGGACSEVPDLHDPGPSEAMADTAVPEAMDVSSSSQGGEATSS